MKKLLLSGLLLYSFSSCVKHIEKETIITSPAFQWTAQASGTNASLRGLSVVDTNVVWASGSKGSFLRSIDSGSTWEAGQVPGADTVDFRDIAAFDAETAYLLSAGTPAYIYKTMDGGDTWVLQYKNTSPGIFFDAFAFWDEEHGIAMSDPVAGHFVLITTEDGGTHWNPIPEENIPSPIEGEAGFAASGTGLVVQGKQKVCFATGGTASRVFCSSDRGMHWQVSQTPMVQGKASTGIFSVAFADSLHGVAVGGDYQKPESSKSNACITMDGGTTWQLVSENTPKGYRSCVAYVPSSNVFVAVGTSGSDYSTDFGYTWSAIDTIGYHVVQFDDNAPIGWAAGSQGRITKIRL